MTRAELDAEAGLADGHAGKLLSDRPRKKLGIVTLGRVMAATGLVLIVADDPDAQAPSQASPTSKSRSTHWRTNKGTSWGRRMAARRALKLTTEQRSSIARKAAQARWQRQQTAAVSQADDASGQQKSGAPPSGTTNT
jgi:hypothetical protein